MAQGRSDGPRQDKPRPRPRHRSAGSPPARAKPRTAQPTRKPSNRKAAPGGSGRKGGTRPSRGATTGRDSGRGRRILKGLGIFVLLLTVAVAVTGFIVYATMSSQLPDPDITKARGRDQSSIIVDRDGKTLVRLWAEENRQDIPLAEMPVHLRQAVIATEDKRFYEHEGVDPLGIARALVVDIARGEKAQGGSTITQQYVKQAFFTSEKTMKRKLQEALLAQKVESRFSKDQILEMYLNTIYFGHGTYGVEAASRAYFGHSVRKVSLEEAALLAAVIKSPGRYSPYLDAEAALARRNTVLDLMLAQGYIDGTEAGEASAAEIELEGIKPRTAAAPYFVEWVKEQLLARYGERRVYRGGLRIETTLDLSAQKAAEKAAEDILDEKGDPSASLVAVRPGTGEVIAMVGGSDFGKQQFNVAVQGRRQPGSAFKPFVLVTALAAGVSPEKAYTSGPIKIPVDGKVWSVTGASGKKGATMRLRKATEKSVNAVFAQLIMEVGADKVAAMAKTLGIDTEVDEVPAIALGGLSRGVSPLEMAEAYATLAAGGTHAEPYAIAKVTDASGKVLEEAEVNAVEALDPAVAYLATDILRGVIKRGTGTAAQIGRPVAGKTGTTQQYRDAWFVGYTPDLATAVWVGYPDSQREMTSVHGRRVTGGSFPAQIWARFMKKALEDEPETAFKRPKGLTRAELCSQTGGSITPYCPDPFKALVLKASRIESCTAHVRPPEVRVPDLIGKTKEDSLSALEAAGLKAAVTERVFPNVASGIVAEQSPVAGTVLKPGDTVKLSVSTGAGTNAPPVAIFAAPTDTRAGKPQTLDGSSSHDDGEIVGYLWEFGDGSTGNGESVSHTWATPGRYEVTLWVTDDRGGQGSITRMLTVR